ncbi:MAG: hypothetical protein P3B98_04505 [Gemmatimonadota bacterium]|nr:hypothetical protein [Gemmatimonadota bacterium]
MPTRYAVALFAHARPDLLAQTLAPLRQAGVPRIRAYVDGSRGPTDDAGHRAVLALLRDIDWAQVELTERPANLGLHASIRAGLDDFFAHEEAGIVLEDDNRLADGAYDWLCAALDQYADDPRVGIINAWAHRRFIPDDVTGPWWSPRWSGWGWAGWRRSWALMHESVDALLRRLASEGIDAEAYGSDVIATARLGFWDSHLGLALYGARMLTLYPPRSLADHIGFGDAATNQHHAGPWRAVPAAPVDERWPFPADVVEHSQSRSLWRAAAMADAPPAPPAAGRLRRRLAIAWHRLVRARRQWPSAVVLRLALWLWRRRRVAAFDDSAPGATTPVRYLWNGFLRRHRDAFFGRGLEIGDCRMLTSMGGSQLTRCEVVDRVAGPGVDYVTDLQAAWALPEGAFDVFLHQFTLHLVADERAALWHALRAVRAEGTLFVTFPCAGAAPPQGETFGATHSHVWRHYTTAGVRALLAELGIDGVHLVLEPLGGVDAQAAYLLGVPVEALDRHRVDMVSEDAPLLLAARITKPLRWSPRWSPSRV